MKKSLYFLILIFLINHVNAQWKEIPGLYLESEYVGMDARQIISDGNFLFAIIDNMVYLSYNDGKSWMRPTGYNGYANCVASLDSELFVGANGVLFSDNLGASFLERNQGLPEHPRVMAIHATDSVLIAAVTSSDPVQVWDAYISFDKGKKWSLAHGLTNTFVQSFTSDGLTLYVATQWGVYRSLDNGRNWTGIGLSDKSVFTVAARGNKIFAAENNSGGYIYFSSDQGVQWNPVPGSGLTTTWFNSIVLEDQYIFVASLWDGVFRSGDDGASWVKTSDGIKTMPVYTLARHKDQLLAGTLDGIAISGNNGSSWNQSIKTYNLQVRDVGVSGNNLLATTSQGINMTSDEGVSWNREFIDMHVIECEDSMVYFGSERGFYYSPDFGKDLYWYDVRGLPDNPGFTDIQATDSLVFGSLYDHGIYFSDDRGINWSERNNGLDQKNIIALALSDSSVIAASDTTGIFISDDLGLHWNLLKSRQENQQLTCLSNFRNYVFAGTTDGSLLKSEDQGKSWSSISFASLNGSINCLYSYGNNLFAGIEGNGLYLSVNNGEDWIPYNQGLVDLNVNSIDGNDEVLYVGSEGGAVWSRDINEFPLSLSVKEIKAVEKVICEGDSVLLTASVIGGKPPYECKWSDGQNGHTVRVHPSGSQKYILQVSDANADTASLEIKIWVRKKPETPVLEMSGDTLISNAVTGNRWYYEDELIQGVISNRFLPQSYGKYTVRTLTGGCLSDKSEEIVYGIMGSGNLNFADQFTVYPNPAHDKLFVRSSLAGSGAIIQMINAGGKVILQQTLSDGELQINTGNFGHGACFLKVIYNGKSIVKKITIE